MIQESRSISSDLSLSSPTSIPLPEAKNDDRAASTLKEEESQSMAEMDPAMASLTQSLEELDRDLDTDLTGGGHRKNQLRRDQNISNTSSPGLKKTGPGSVPLLASTEDISVAVMNVMKKPHIQNQSPGKKSKNPESYSTVV